MAKWITSSLLLTLLLLIEFAREAEGAGEPCVEGGDSCIAPLECRLSKCQTKVLNADEPCTAPNTFCDTIHLTCQSGKCKLQVDQTCVAGEAKCVSNAECLEGDAPKCVCKLGYTASQNKTACNGAVRLMTSSLMLLMVMLTPYFV